MSMTFDQLVVGKKLSVVDEILLLNPNQTPFINLLGFSAPVTQTMHQWFEDEVYQNDSTATAAYLATDTSIVVAAIEPFRVNQVVKVGDELIKITAIAGNTLTVSRGYASTTAAPITNGAKVEVMFDEGVEGANARAARYKSRVPQSNYTQIFDDTIQISGTAQAVTQYGVNDLYGYERQKKQLELALHLEKSLINGVAYQNGQVRTMKGIRQFIQTNVTDVAGVALTDTMINDKLQAIYEKGGFATGGNYKIVVGAKQKRAVSELSKNNIRLSQDETIRGQVVRVFVSDFGSFEINLNNNLAPDELLIVDANRMAIRPLNGREFFHKYMGEVGDSMTGTIVGEYTLEFRQEKAHARIKGLA